MTEKQKHILLLATLLCYELYSSVKIHPNSKSYRLFIPSLTTEIKINADSMINLDITISLIITLYIFLNESISPVMFNQWQNRRIPTLPNQLIGVALPIMQWYSYIQSTHSDSTSHHLAQIFHANNAQYIDLLLIFMLIPEAIAFTKQVVRCINSSATGNPVLNQATIEANVATTSQIDAPPFVSSRTRSRTHRS